MSQSDAQNSRKAVARNVINQKPDIAHSTVLGVQVSQYSGPIPHPDILLKYNEALPNAAERIVAMAEREQRHSHRIDYCSMVLTFSGTLGGFLVCFGALAGGLFLIYKDKPLSGFLSFCSGVGLLSGGYWVHKQTQGNSVKKDQPKGKPVAPGH